MKLWEKPEQLGADVAVVVCVGLWRVLARRATRMKKEGDQPTGWILEADKVIVIEQTDTFGRREFDWENVPSTLIDDNASVGGRTVLNRRELEEFLGAKLSGRKNSLLDRIVGRS